MGRKPIPIQEEILREEVLKHDPQANQQALFKKVAESYEARTGLKVQPQMIRIRIREFNIPLQTEPNRGLPTKKSKVDLSHMKEYVPPEFHYLVDRAEISKIAAVKLKCLDCSGWVKREVRECTVKNCGLHHIRPYKAA
jgi:hypothetical protein